MRPGPGSRPKKAPARTSPSPYSRGIGARHSDIVGGLPSPEPKVTIFKLPARRKPHRPKHLNRPAKILSELASLAQVRRDRRSLWKWADEHEVSMPDDYRARLLAQLTKGTPPACVCEQLTRELDPEFLPAQRKLLASLAIADLLVKLDRKGQIASLDMHLPQFFNPEEANALNWARGFLASLPPANQKRQRILHAAERLFTELVFDEALDEEWRAVLTREFGLEDEGES